MTDIASGPSQETPKLIAGRDTKLVLAAGCLAVIGVGAWLAPRKDAMQAAAPPPEAAAPLLQEEQERRAPQVLFRKAHERGAGLAVHVLTIVAPPDDRPQTVPDAGVASAPEAPRGYAVAVDGEHLMTHRSALNTVDVRLLWADDVVREGRVVALDPDNGTVLVQVDGGGLTAAPTSTETAAAGDGAVAVGRQAGGYWAAPVIVAGRSESGYSLAGFGPLGLPGLPVFDAAGRLMAVLTGTAGPHNAVDAHGTLERLRRRQTRGLPRTLGVRLQAIDARLREPLGAGVLVADVDEHAAETPDLRPGDVILKVGSTPVVTPTDVTAALESAPPGEALQVQLRRGRRTLTATAVPRIALHPPPPPRRSVPPVRAHDVFDEESLRAAGVPDGSRIVAIEGTPVRDLRSLRTRPRARRPTLVLFDDDGTRFFAVIDPA